MKQMIVDYFTKQSGSENIVDHYVWFMHAGTTVLIIVAAVSNDNKLTTHDSYDLSKILREYIDEMDDAYCGREPEEV